MLLVLLEDSPGLATHSSGLSGDSKWPSEVSVCLLQKTRSVVQRLLRDVARAPEALEWVVVLGEVSGGSGK